MESGRFEVVLCTWTQQIWRCPKFTGLWATQKIAQIIIHIVFGCSNGENHPVFDLLNSSG